MKYTIACTYCQKEYPVEDRMAGKRAKCKKCGEVFTVPPPPPPPPPAPQDEDAIDLSAFDEVEPAAPAYAPPPISSRRQAASAPPAYSPPPMYSAPRTQVSWGGNWAGGARRAWWSVPIILIIVVLKLLGVFHTKSGGNKSGGWNPDSAASMTLDQKRDQTAANLQQLGPALRRQTGLEPTIGHFGPTLVHFDNLPHSWFISPFDPAPASSGSEDYKFVHLEAFTNARLSHAIVLYDDSELSASDGTTVYRADGTVEHLSKEDFERQRDADEFALEQAHPLFSGMMAPRPPAPGPVVQPPPAPSPVTSNSPTPANHIDDFVLNSKRGNTTMILGQIYGHMRNYPGTARDELPPSLDVDTGGPLMFKDSELHSPFGPQGSKGDYAYHRYDTMRWPPPRAVIIVYDQAEHNSDTETAVLHANGNVEFIKNTDWDAAMRASDAAAAMAHANLLAGKVNPPDPVPPEKVVPDPPIPAHAWSAEPDPPLSAGKINPKIRMVYQGSDDFYFPPQPSQFMFLHRSVGSGIPGRAAADELWDLKASRKVSSIPVIKMTWDMMLSPDGNYFAGRIMSGQGEATVFEVWSPRTGKLVQTLSSPPAASGLADLVGFMQNDQLLTLGDHFYVWDLKTGTLVRPFGGASKQGVYALFAASPTGKLAALVSNDHQNIQLFDTASGKLLGQSPIPDKQAREYEYGTDVNVLKFSPDGQYLAVLLNGTRIYNWKIADGSLVGRFSISPPVDRNNIPKTDGPADTMAWLPDSQGWLLAGDRVADRVTGATIYQMPVFTEKDASEYGERQVIDDGHILLGFRPKIGSKTALETLGFDSAAMNKARDATRAAAPATQPN